MTLTLPVAYRGVHAVRTVVASKVRTVRVVARRVTVSFAGQHGGLTAVVIGRKGKPSVKRFYVLCNQGDIGGSNLPVPSR